jgi:hypothetical protein
MAVEREQAAHIHTQMGYQIVIGKRETLDVVTNGGIQDGQP